MELRGTLRREFFGGEVWVLDAEDGARYQLVGRIPRELADRRVTVAGRPSPEGMGFSMVGEVIAVSRIERA